MSLEKSTLDTLRIDRTDTGRNVSGTGILWLCVVLVVIALLAGAGWWFYHAKPIEVRTAVAREASAGRQQTVLNASGYVTARRQATVSSKVTGKVVEVLFEEGTEVKEGQILARLDSSNVVANLRLAEAQAKATQTGLEETRILITEAECELKRIAELIKSRVVSQAELDRANAEADSLKARLARQQDEVEVAQRQVALWEQQMEDIVIRAPFTGIVVAKNAQPGEMISPISAGGGFTRTGICTLVDMQSLEVEVDVNESYINRVRAGQAVQAVLDAYSDWKIPAKVIAIIPAADRQKATVKVRIGFEALDSRMLPDMGVKVAFQSAGSGPVASQGVLIPKTAARRQDNRDVVLVARNGRIERRTITRGEERGEEIMVPAGVAAGEKVVVAGPANLVDGSRITEAKR